MDKEIVQKVLDAVQNGNKRALNSLLGCHDKETNGVNLSPPSNLAAILFDEWRKNASADKQCSTGPLESLSMVHAFQALLMIHPCSSTPWMALAEMAKGIRQLSRNDLFHCVSSISTFLRDASLSMSLQPSACEPWVLLASKEVMDKLLDEPRFRQMGSLLLLCDLIRIMFTFTKNNLSSGAKEQFQQLVFLRDFSSGNVSVWLQLVQTLSGIITAGEMNIVKDRILEYLHAQGSKASVKVLLSLMDLSMDIATSQVRESQARSLSTKSSWYQVPLCVLVIAQHRRMDYITLLLRLSTKLNTYTATSLAKFYIALEGWDGCPEWIQADIFLTLGRCMRRVNTKGVEKRFPIRVKRCAVSGNTSHDCTGKLLDLMVPEKESIQQLGLNDIFTCDKMLIVEVLGDLSYGGAGRFVDTNGSSVQLLTKAGKLLLKLLEPVNSLTHTNDVERTYLEHMTTALLELAATLLHGKTRQSETRVMVFFATIVTMLYNEVQSCRQSISRLIRKGLLWHGADRMQKQACIVAASLIIGSIGGGGTQSNESDDQFLAPCLQWVERPVDAETFMYLVTCLVSTRLATKMLLQSSVNLLGQAHARSWDAGSGEENSDNGLIRAGLFGLLEIVRVSSWRDDEKEAWSILSNCLVLDVPHIGLVDRQWIYQQIEDVLNDGDMDEEVSRHFLRAIITRLAKFVIVENDSASCRFVPENTFIVWEDSSIGRIQTVQTEDVVSLLRLSLCLLSHGARMVDSSHSAQQSRGHDLLLRLVLGYRGRGKKDHSKVISKMLKSWCEVCGDDTHSIHLVAIVAYFAVAFQYLGQAEKSFSSLLASEDFETLEKCLSFVLSQERDSLERCLDDSRPFWSTLAVIDHMSSREIDVDPLSMASVQISLCELLVETLCGGAFRTISDDGISLETCRSVVLVLGFMLQLRQKLILQVTQQSLRDYDLKLNHTAVKNVATEFFPAASRVVQDLIARNASLQEAQEFFQAIVLYCQAISDSPDVVEATAWSQDLRSVWVLYQVLSSEKGATDLIQYLESNSKTEMPTFKADASTCSLISVKSPVDVDESIRRIRLSVLKALEKLLHHASNSMGLNKPETAGQSSFFNENSRNDESEALLIAGVLRATVLDLRKGLEGKSGGITAAMYESYLSSIRSCGSLMFQLTSEIEPCAWFGVIPVVVEVTSLIREIMRSFPLDDAALFRSSLIMAIADLPSLLRHMLRKCVLSQQGDDMIQCHVVDPSNDMVTALFDDCLDILSRWSTLRDPNSVPWEDIAGRVHMEGQPGKCFTHSQVTLKSVQAASPAEPHRDRDHKDESRRIEVQLGTKEIWSWAMSCTFVAWEENWLGSYQATLPTGMVATSCIEGAPCDSVQFMLDNRKRELNSLLTKAAELFSATVASGSRVEQAALDMLAMNLPSAPRLRFCHFLASVTKVLIHSTQQLIHFLNAESPISNGNLITIRLLEALSGLCAWLVIDDPNADFTVGAYRWLSILRRKRPHGLDPNARIQTTELVPWVTKVSLLIRDLYSGLRNVERVLSRVPKMHPLEGFVRQTIGGGLGDMLHLTTRKVRLLELTMPAEYSAPSLPDFPTLAVDDSTTGKKRRIRRHSSHTRSKKRATTQIARSRNRIVNAFMNLDKNTGDKDGSLSDAFIDLEDFLVEG